MIISLTFELTEPIGQNTLARLLHRLLSIGWMSDKEVQPVVVGYLRPESVATHTYDFVMDAADADALIAALPQSFQLIDIRMRAPWNGKSLSVHLVIDNIGLTFGFDVAHDLLLDEERPDKEKANLSRFVDLAEPLLAELRPRSGAIAEEADVRSEYIGLDWRFWSSDIVKQADPLSLAEVQRTAYIYRDFGPFGLFVAMTPLLFLTRDKDYEIRMGILNRTFGDRRD